MKDSIDARFRQLLLEGRQLVDRLPGSRAKNPDWVDYRKLGEYQAWLTSSVNLLRVISPSDSQYIRECDRLLASESLRTGIPIRTVLRVYGLLEAAKTDWDAGLLRSIELVIAAQTLDSFLDRAEEFQRAGMKAEAATLSSIVLEDSLKRIARSRGVTPDGLSIEPLVDELTRKGVFSSVKAKRIKGLAGVRNKALHASWDDFDQRDVKGLIEGARELIDTYLGGSA